MSSRPISRRMQKPSLQTLRRRRPGRRSSGWGSRQAHRNRRLTFTADLPTAVRGADLVQENGPERIDFKKKLYRQLDELLPADVIIASSSSGLTMSEIQSGCRVCTPSAASSAIRSIRRTWSRWSRSSAARRPRKRRSERASEFYTGSGQADRPPAQGSARACRQSPAGGAWRGRSITWSPKASSASPTSTPRCAGDPGLRWGIMGNVMLNHLGGGQGGIEHFFQQFTGPMTAWWKVLGSPVLTPEVQKKLIDGVHAEVGSRSIDELEAERDEVLLGLLELRSKAEKTPATPKAAARAG